MPPSPRRRSADGESGYTIIEVMVAMVILLVAVVATLSLYESSLASTSRTTAREQGTNLARDLIERSREVAYAGTKIGAVAGALRSALPASDNATVPSAARTFTVTRRGTTFTVNVFACSVDLDTDGVGVADDTFCAGPRDITGTTPPADGLAPPVNVLGLSVNLGSNAVSTVCNALGNPALLAVVQNTVSTVAPLSTCPNAGIGDVTSANVDRDPDDMHRVRVTVSWTSSNRPETISQTTLIASPNP